MKHLKPMGRFAPRVLRSLLIAVLVVTMTGISTVALAARHQTPPLQSALEPSDAQLIARALPGVYTIPASCSVPIIPAILTETEVELRQYQADFAKFIEEQAKLDEAAALTHERDVLAIERFRLDCDIRVLQAKQILQAASTPPLPNLPVTLQEVELRQRQFDLAKQIDNYEALAQEAGVASIDRVWRARRNRIDAEILLLQATVHQKLRETS